MTINQILSEMKKEFLQYSSEGYSGGKDGLRCFECDRKYSGEASYGQLCAVCNFHSYTRKLIESLAEEIEQIYMDLYKEKSVKNYNEIGVDGVMGYNIALDDVSLKVKEIITNLK